MSETNIREEICRLGRSLFERGLTPGSSGNISVKLDDGGWLVTPTNASLGFQQMFGLSSLPIPNFDILSAGSMHDAVPGTYRFGIGSGPGVPGLIDIDAEDRPAQFRPQHVPGASIDRQRAVLRKSP